jgi:hypothetical protein
MLSLLCMALGAAPFEWRLPPALAVVDVPVAIEANGVPVRLHAALVEGRIEDLAPKLARDFVAAGLYLAPVAPEDRHLTALDPQRLVSYTIAFEQTTKTRVTLVWGEAALSKLLESNQSSQLPVFPGARGVLRTSAEGLRTVWFVSDASESEVAGFYRATLGSAGWSEKSAGTFQRADGAQVSIRVKGHQVLLVETKARPGPE